MSSTPEVRGAASVARPAPHVARPSGQRVQVLGREEVARGTLALRLARPPGFGFRAGQAIDLDLGAAGRHAFSLASAPFESDLLVATRMRASAYKQALGELERGEEVGIHGPFGSLVLHRSAMRDAVFIAGGIGITPFRSIVRQAARDRDTRRITLVYANRGPEDAPFLDELIRLGNEQGPFRLMATMTDMANSRETWTGLRGIVNASLVTEAARGLSSPVFYMAGPPGMVGAARMALAHAGIDDDDIRGEEFHGY
jgi:ferredoxin-NADP reductase